MASYKNTLDATVVSYDNQNNVIENTGRNVTILAGTGNDSISNSGDNVTINGGAGNNSIYSYAGDVSIVVGAGKDFISIENSRSVSITSGAGDDTVIFAGGGEGLINVGTGNNSVENGGDNVTIISGNGNDTINNNDENVFFQYGGGNDVIYGFKNSSTLQIASGSITSALTNVDTEGKGDATLAVGSNTIVLKDLGTVGTINVVNASGTVEIFNVPILIAGTEGADSITNENIGATIQALGGNDSIYNSGVNALIDGGAGADSIDNRGDKVLINGGTDDDYIDNYGASATIAGGDGTDYIFNNSSENVSITGGAGDDSIYNSANCNNATLDGGDGADYIENNSDNVLIDAGAGNDFINNYYGVNVTINTGAGDDTVSNANGNILINLSAGNNSVENINADDVSIISGAGADSIYNTGANMFFQYGGGSDIVEGFSETSTLQIVAGSISNALSDGVDAIFTIGADILTLKDLGLIGTINVMDASGAGEPFIIPILIEGTGNADDLDRDIENATIKTYGGNDYISNSAASVTIDAGNGNNTIYSSGDNVVIKSGAGKSYIDNRGNAVSIAGGRGNYEIYNDGYNVTINGGAGNDSVTLSNGYYDDGNIFLYKKGDSKDKIYSYNENDTIKITDDSSVTADIDGEDIVFKIGTGSITFKDMAEETTGKKITFVNSKNEPILEENIYVTAGIITGDTIKLTESYTDTYQQGDGIIVVDGSQLKKGIEIESMDTVGAFLGGNGKDTLSTDGDSFELTGGKGDDLFVFGGGNATINDYSLTGTNGKDKIELRNLSVTYHTIDDDNNLILTCDETNTLTIKKGGNKKLIFEDNKAGVIYIEDGVFDAKKKSILLKTTTTDFSAAKQSKLVTIDGTAAEGTINILGNKKSNYIMAGNNGATLNGGKGKDSLDGGDGADLFIYEKNTGNDTIYYYSDGDKISLGSGVTIKDATIKRGNAVIKFKGGSLTVDNATELIFVGDGAETLFSNGVFFDTVAATAKVYGSFKDTISLDGYEDIKDVDASAGKKAVIIDGNTENNSLVGGNGKDEISGGYGNDTLFGGKGSDSLWGGVDNDTFIYQAGTGSDTIVDYESGELVQILDKKGRTTTFTEATFNVDTLTLKVNGGGKVTFQNVSDETEFNINGSTYAVSGTTIAKK